jgi:hypothetical protein
MEKAKLNKRKKKERNYIKRAIWKATLQQNQTKLRIFEGANKTVLESITS